MKFIEPMAAARALFCRFSGASLQTLAGAGAGAGVCQLPRARRVRVDARRVTGVRVGASPRQAVPGGRRASKPQAYPRAAAAGTYSGLRRAGSPAAAVEDPEVRPGQSPGPADPGPPRACGLRAGAQGRPGSGPGRLCVGGGHPGGLLAPCLVRPFPPPFPVPAQISTTDR